jgi:hypothetical protein
MTLHLNIMINVEPRHGVANISALSQEITPPGSKGQKKINYEKVHQAFNALYLCHVGYFILHIP